MATINEANDAYNAIVAAVQGGFTQAGASRVGVTAHDAANARAITAKDAAIDDADESDAAYPAADVTEAMAIMAAVEAMVPKGPYCYAGGAKGEAPCPFWGWNPDEAPDMAGYCALLKHGDWMDDGGLTFLFDRLKACGIRDGADFDDADFDGADFDGADLDEPAESEASEAGSDAAAPDYDIDADEQDDSADQNSAEQNDAERNGDSLDKAPAAP